MSSVVKISIETIAPAILTLIFILLDKKTSFNKLKYWLKQIIFGICFGGLAVLGTEIGIPMNGATVNVRDGAVITAGLIFGAPAGIIAGLIGGIERYFAVLWGAGTYTRIACTVSTALAGLYAGIVRKYLLENKKPSFGIAACAGLVIEVFHITMVFVTNMNDTYNALRIVKAVTPIMIPANAISCFISAYVANLLDPKIKDNNTKSSVTSAIQKWLLAVVVIVFILSSTFVADMQYSIANAQVKTLLSEAIESVVNDVKDASDAHILNIARKAANDVNSGKSIHDIYKQYNVLDMSIVDENGIITDSLIDSYIGFDFHSGEQAQEFLPLLDATTGINEYVQDYQPISMDSSILRKFAAVKLKTGFIQVGYDAACLQDDIASTVSNITKNRHIGETGYMIVINKNESIVSAPTGYKSVLMNKYLLDSNEANTVYSVTIGGVDYYCEYAISEGYTLIALLPQEEANHTRDIAVYANTFMEIIVFGLMFAMIYMLIKRVIINRIKKVNKSLEKITNGDLDEVVNVKEFSELELLSNDINATVDTLKQYIQEANARIDAELNYAKNIQNSALPHIFPNDERISLYALMDAAKEVGGDFYDFYSTKDNNLNFMIADVSGKGIPGAMFMMRAKSELHSLTDNGLEVNEVFTRGNNRLCSGNDAGMFVTSWQGCIDLNTGLIKYANAGHNHPIIIHNDGTCEFLNEKVALVLAGMEDIQYKTQELQLNKGDILFLYTDGVVEATNSNKELYSAERLLQCAEKVNHSNMKELCEQVLNDVNNFVDGEEQFDDITMLAIKFNGNE